MDKAKAAVSGFVHKHGHHDTTVEERTAPAVTHENVIKARHEDVQKAVDKEIHQDHYHTSVQPIKDKQVLPEQHHHNAVPVEHREHHHGDSSGLKARLEQEAAQFKDERMRGETQHTQSVAPTVGGEHRHHHVHETIQPVIERQTVQPSVVHTTVPVHEVHHAEAQHHRGETLPAMTMEQFKSQAGGHHGGERVVRDGFEGEPQGWAAGHGGMHESIHHKGNHGVASGSGAGSGVGSGAGSGTGTHTGTHTGTGSTSTTQIGQKASFMDRLNPMKDTDGDGKKGIMD